jgi:phage shock protein A
MAGVTERVWNALTAIIKLEDKVSRQSEALKAQQSKIENLTERVIRLETQLELLTSAAIVKKLGRG